MRVKKDVTGCVYDYDLEQFIPLDHDRVWVATDPTVIKHPALFDKPKKEN